MANSIKGGGLRFIRSEGESSPILLCYHDSGDSAALGRGDAVKTGGDSTSIAGMGQMKTVARVAAGDPIFGVVVGTLNHLGNNPDLSKQYCPASTAMAVLVRVANHSDIYAISEDGTMATTAIGDNANLTGNGGGTTITACSSTTGLSTMLLDSSTADTTATLQLKTIGYEPQVGNTPGAANSSVLVLLNNIEASGGTGTAGV